MSYTVKQLAELSTISVRTLHFYDEIGLLKPAYYADNGYRHYETEQLLLLQQILFYRELEFSLSEIQKILRVKEFDKVEALKSHKRKLEKDARRTSQLIQTIDKTIASLTGGKPMKPKDMYMGFDTEKQAEYEAQWIKNGGKKQVEESRKNTKDWKRADYENVNDEFEELEKLVTVAIEKKFSPDAPQVQKIVRRHYQLIRRFYEPTKEIYRGLGKMYVENPDFRKRYDTYHPKQAEFWAKAMKVFADKEL